MSNRTVDESNVTTVTEYEQAPFRSAAASAGYDKSLALYEIKQARGHIRLLNGKMPLNIALALQRADTELRDAEAWLSLEES